MRAKKVCLRLVIGPGRAFVHVSRLRQFHLDRVNTALRTAIMPGGPTTLEPSIQDRGVSSGVTAYLRHAVLDPRMLLLVPMLKSGSVPSKRNGICERIEWQS